MLRAEVWFGILGAVFVVAFLIWALDRFSPYSYYNNKVEFPVFEIYCTESKTVCTGTILPVNK